VFETSKRNYFLEVCFTTVKRNSKTVAFFNL